MMTILFDSDVVIDFFLNREPFCSEAGELFERLVAGQFSASMTATSILNIYYIVRKPLEKRGALDCIEKILETDNLFILSVEKRHLLEALASGMPDYEDAVQAAASDLSGLDYIVTRNLKDYRLSPVKAVSPREFLEIVQKERDTQR